LLTPKEISQRFEVQLNTLYNWRKTKPKLYAYLQNADYNLQKSKEINVLLDNYSDDFQASFTLEEIEFLIASDLEVFSIEEIENLENLFIKIHYKQIPSKNKFLLGVYDNIRDLNIIQKYILYKKVFKSRKEDIGVSILEYFKEFIKQQ
jgi:murein DD-endopeptidase MepM/ murein hydrolase activator NlpD